MKTLRFRIDPETECWNVVSHDRGRDYPRIGRNGRYYKIHRWVNESLQNKKHVKSNMENIDGDII